MMASRPPTVPAISPFGLNLPDSSAQEEGATAGSSTYSPNPPAQSQPHPKNRLLLPDEWDRVVHGVGAIKTSGEDHGVVHPSCSYYPPKGLPDGLYRDVIYQKTKFSFMYLSLSAFRWVLMIMQIILGAVLTALGSADLREGIPITVLAASQTVIAGLLALMHNSGLPERYRFLRWEFSEVEDRLRYARAASLMAIAALPVLQLTLSRGNSSILASSQRAGPSTTSSQAAGTISKRPKQQSWPTFRPTLSPAAPCLLGQ